MSAGVMLTPRALGTLAALYMIGRLIMHVDARLIIAVGFAASAVSALMLTRITADIGAFPFAVASFANGFGLGCIWAPTMTLMFNTLPPAYRTEGAMLVNLVRSYGSGLGISVAAVVLARSHAIAYAELSEHVTLFREALQLPDAGGRWSLETASGLAALGDEVSRQAFMFGILNNFLWASAAAAVAVPLAFMFRRRAGSGP